MPVTLCRGVNLEDTCRDLFCKVRHGFRRKYVGDRCFPLVMLVTSSAILFSGDTAVNLERIVAIKIQSFRSPRHLTDLSIPRQHCDLIPWHKLVPPSMLSAGSPTKSA